MNCTDVEWDSPDDDGGGISEYRVRIYSGSDYISSPESQQFTVNGTTTRVTPNWLTTKRSRFAFVIVCNVSIVHGANSYMQFIIISNTTCCCQL